jgi:hypothetical protein
MDIISLLETALRRSFVKKRGYKSTVLLRISQQANQIFS